MLIEAALEKLRQVAAPYPGNGWVKQLGPEIKARLGAVLNTNDISETIVAILRWLKQRYPHINAFKLTGTMKALQNNTVAVLRTLPPQQLSLAMAWMRRTVARHRRETIKWGGTELKYGNMLAGDGGGRGFWQ